ncbi:hypothetical protein HPB47_006319 [Ixodes persulcatus]|uniref:Uncharacterized protein n=1 Tax=Ixodes persulcatus TaxID=34615 RepID=A0AC60PAJ9_IXOPE|nr:hypothetical protein HPB47_006319 [Ixodes persulcatus]
MQCEPPWLPASYTHTQQWQRATQKKQSLELYRKHNSEPAPYRRYRGHRASALVLQARTGCLLTQSRRCELYGDDPACPLCGEEEETIDHIMQTTKARRETEDTERRLVLWERLCRNMETRNGYGLQK